MAGVTDAWSADYTDVRSRFLGDEAAAELYARYPELPKSSLTGCPTCGGARTHRWTLDGDITHAEDLPCDCEMQLHLAKLYLHAGVGDLYQRLDWSDYPATSDQNAIKVATGWLAKHKELSTAGIGLILFGTYGTGKTLLLNLIAKELVKLGYDTFASTFSELIQIFTAGWNDAGKQRQFERRILTSRVLVIDDIGKEFKSSNNLGESTLDMVLRSRVQNSRPTLLTTNAESIGGIVRGDRGAILSLLSERSLTHHMSGDDFRPMARERSIAEARVGIRRPVF